MSEFPNRKRGHRPAFSQRYAFALLGNIQIFFFPCLCVREAPEDAAVVVLVVPVDVEGLAKTCLEFFKKGNSGLGAL